MAPHFYGFDDSVFEVALHEPAAAGSGVPEALLHDLWASQSFNREIRCTSEGETLHVLDPGRLNRDGGPDFRGARLRIGGREWGGDVEIHLASMGWTDHRHHQDPRYNSVILHVVLQPDLSTGKLLRADGTPLPELVLYPYLSESVRALVHRFKTRPAGQLPCAGGWPSVPEQVRDRWIGTLGIERLHMKKQRLAELYLHTGHLESLLHEQIMAALGYAPNTEPMRSLARRIPLSLARSITDPLDLEALHFGVAGLLPSYADLLQADRETADYAIDLRDRFEGLNRSLDVPVMNHESWQFFRLRPANFPPLRIAQAVALLRSDPPGLLHENPLQQLARTFRSANPLPALYDLLSPTPGPFWTDHVRLDRRTRTKSARLGRQRAGVLIVNAVAPVMLVHAEQAGDPSLEEAVFGVLRRLPAEQDEVNRTFETLGARARHALAAQGLHQLYRTRCTEARCLSCDVGRHLLGRHQL
jgi:hypothetical protein